MSTSTIDIPGFEGKDVLETTIAIRNAGDGLSKAMEIDPVVLKHGQKVYVVLECEVEKVRHDPIAGTTSALTRVHMLKAGTAAIVDKDLVAAQLEEQERRIEAHAAKKDAAGDPQLDGQLDLAGEQHELDHEDGKHASGLVDGCPLCDSEKAAMEDEAE